jgi:hypothetical protein
MQSLGELQQLDNWSVNPEIRIAYVSKGILALYPVLCGLAHLCDDGGSSSLTKLATFMDDAEADGLAFMSAGIEVWRTCRRPHL